MANVDQADLEVVEIDFFEVEMPSSSCASCDDAKSTLERAIAATRQALRQIGIDPVLRARKVKGVSEASYLRMMGSPTIRIGDREIHPTHQNSAPDCGAGEQRTWHWRGQSYDSPPDGMFAEALLALAGANDRRKFGPYHVPAYLAQYLDRAL